MHNHLWHHTSEEEAEQAKCEPEIGPVMSVLHHLQSVTVKVDGTVEVHFMKSLHWYFAFAMILGSMLFAVEMQIMLHRSAWISSLLIFSRRYGGS